jgi:hypothetical protein
MAFTSGSSSCFLNGEHHCIVEGFVVTSLNSICLGLMWCWMVVAAMGLVGVVKSCARAHVGDYFLRRLPNVLSPSGLDVVGLGICRTLGRADSGAGLAKGGDFSGLRPRYTGVCWLY